jgi:hypothetical protein
MKIANAADLTNISVQGLVTRTLTSGETVSIAVPAQTEDLWKLGGFVENKKPVSLMEMMSKEYSDKPVFRIDQTIQNSLNRHVDVARPDWTKEQKLKIGIGSGVVAGIGVALLVELAKATSPQAGVIGVIASMAIGGGVGAVLAGRVIDFSVTIDPKTGLPVVSASGSAA